MIAAAILAAIMSAILFVSLLATIVSNVGEEISPLYLQLLALGSAGLFVLAVELVRVKHRQDAADFEQRFAEYKREVALMHEGQSRLHMEEASLPQTPDSPASKYQAKSSDSDDLYLYMLAAGYLHERSLNESTDLAQDGAGREQIDFDRGQGLDEFDVW